MCDYRVDFYSNACHVCRVYGNNVSLKRCSSCKMIAYCSREHQREHWPRHKDLCRILADIVQRAGTIYDVREKRGVNTMESWIRTKASLALLIQIKLGRKLLPDEANMLHFPRACEICYETDSQKLVDCSNCPCTSFCYDHRPKNNEHAAKCKTLKLCFDIATAPYIWPESVCTNETNRHFPKNMYDAVAIHSLPCNSIKLAPNIWAAHVSEYLTRPYTILWAMKKLKEQNLSYLTIHTIGADVVETNSLECWEILLHYHKSIKELRIVLIGPELRRDSYTMKVCNSCMDRNATIFIETIDELYINYVKSKRFVKPNYVVGFNLGIYECESLDRDTWPPSLIELMKQDCPFFMTSYTLQESEKEQDRLDRVLGDHVEYLYSGKNLFSSLRPHRDFESEDFFYSNQYITIYETLG